MKQMLCLLLAVVWGMTCHAQSDDFVRVFEACRLAQSSMSCGEGSLDEIRNATDMLMKASWEPLVLQNDNVAGEASIKGHLVFSPAFFRGLQNGRNVYKRAERYAKEAENLQRGGTVQLCTKCIKANDCVTYRMKGIGGAFNIAAVAEVNGLINLKVMVKDSGGQTSQLYKVNSDEFRGASFRRLETITLPKGITTIYITIENRSSNATSVAIVTE